MKNKLLPLTSPHANYERAYQLMRMKNPDFSKAALLLSSAYDKGDMRAAYALATWHLFGYGGFSRNLPKAVTLLRRAAKANLPAAHFDLAVCLETGCGMAKNEGRAFQHYLAAAIHGDSSAFHEVGRCLHYGIGIARNRKAARIWLNKTEPRTS